MIATERIVATPKVLLDGTDLATTVGNALARVTVEAQRNLPAMCTVELADHDRTLVDRTDILPGATVEVLATSVDEDSPDEHVFKGEVVSIEASFAADDMARVVVVGYDLSHRLHRQRRTRTFLEQRDSAVAQTIAAEHGLQVQADSSPIVHDYLCQYNQTDWEFLAERAREIGFEVIVHDERLTFRESKPQTGSVIDLELGRNLRTHRVRASSADQPAKTTVRGWDPVRKEPVQGEETNPGSENAAGTAVAATKIATSFGTTADLVTDPALVDTSLARTRATARRYHLATSAVEGEGTADGAPQVRPGVAVKLSQLGKHFDGTYVVTHVRHTIDERGYRTWFATNGRNDRTLLGLTEPGIGTGGRARAADHTTAPVVGIVTNTNDPDTRGRVKVKFPWLDDNLESHWAPVVAPGAGRERGLQVIPEIEDEVLVCFASGDVRRPFVLGGLWNGKDAVPAADAVASGKTELRVLKTRIGHVLTFDDTNGTGRVSLVTAGGHKLELSDVDKSVSITDSTGTCRLGIDANSRNIDLEAGADITITSTGNMKLESMGNMDLEAKGRLNLKGTAGVAIDTPATLNAKASGAATFEATGPATVKSAAIMTVQGTLVKIN